MKEKVVKAAILYLLKVADEERTSFGKVRLMKFLYLLDVEHYRYYGETCTGLEWVFYKYGPFAFELESFLAEIKIKNEEIPLEKGKTLKKLNYDFDLQDEVTKPPFRCKGILDNLFKEWGSADLNRLLDYVYFGTEPMVDAQLPDRLDFMKIILHEKSQAITISPAAKKKLKEICNGMRRSLDQIEVSYRSYLTSPQDLRITSIWDREDATDLEYLKGIVKLERKEPSK